MVASGEAERRQLTVLFCDLVGSTQIASEVGAEEWLGLLKSYQKRVAEIVERFDGSIAQFLGDGVVAYFGHPHAHEDDAERAVRAGLAVAEALVPGAATELKARSASQLAVRCGIHTGVVVIGEMGSGARLETLAVGATSDIAARIQGEAKPGQVLVSADTLRLVRGLFVTEDLGSQVLDGVAAPARLYRVIRPTGATTRLDADAALTPFVAREQELDLLEECWTRAREGQGQIALLGGEAGMGKSRLIRVFRNRLAKQPHQWIECRASKFHTHTAFYPLIEPMSETLHVDAEQPVEQQRRQLEAGLASLGLDPTEATLLSGTLFGIPFEEGDSPFADAAEGRLQLMFGALTKWLLAMAESQPLVFVIEDLHWVDSSTLEFLSRLIDRVSESRVLLMPTYRLSFEPPWNLGSNARRVALNPLSRSQTEAMMTGIVGGSSLPNAVRNQVVAKTDGVPLFIEEFTQTVLESGVLSKNEEQWEETGPIPDFAVPTTLQDSLMARLDRLGAAKNVAQMASVVGRELSRDVLAAIVTEPQTLERDLESLVGAGILHRSSHLGRDTYSFKHALIQETAYHSLLKSTRRTWHARVVRGIEARVPALAFAEPERLAWHCEEGDLIEKAIGYCRSAAEQAQRRSASAETIRHLSHGIELLRTLPESRERSERELMLQIELGMSLVAAEGWGSNNAKAAYADARELSDNIGELPQVFRVMRGLITFHTARAELPPARELANRLMDLAKQSGESHLLLLAHHQKGIIHYFEGAPTSALEQLEKAVSFYEPTEHRRLAELHGEDLGVMARIWMAWPQWLLGRPDLAVATSRSGLDLGEQVGHHFSLAYAFVWTAILFVMRKEPQRAKEMAEQAIEISERQGFAFLLAEGQLVVAWARLHEQLDEDAMRRAAAEFQACVTRVGSRGIMANGPMMIGFLSEAYQRAGQHTQALASVTAALTLSQATGQMQWDAELHRLNGEYLLQSQGDSSEVESLFERGLEIASEQHALSLELRVASSLGRLWKARGEHQRARDLLAPIYARFSEGFDSPDLLEAKALLDA